MKELLRHCHALEVVMTQYYLVVQMSSQGDQHDEFDFEFLGNTSREPFVVQMNVYSKGASNWEQHFFLMARPNCRLPFLLLMWNR